MTWHKMGTRYNLDKLVHPSNAESWTHFDVIHGVKADEARNMRVALANRWLQFIWNVGCTLHLLACVRYSPQSPSRRDFPMT